MERVVLDCGQPNSYFIYGMLLFIFFPAALVLYNMVTTVLIDWDDFLTKAIRYEGNFVNCRYQK